MMVINPDESRKALGDLDTGDSAASSNIVPDFLDWAENSLEYQKFSGLHGDIPGYEFAVLALKFLLVAYCAEFGLDPADVLVVDWGSHTGDNTARLKELGARIIGVDINEEVVEIANEEYGDKTTEFLQVGQDSPIPDSIKNADIVTAFFLHPTFKTVKELYEQIKRIESTMKPGAILMMMGLNPECFKFGKFISYNLPTPPEEGWPAGYRFTNTLVNNIGRKLSFPDTFFPNTTMRDAFIAAGLIPTILSVNDTLDKSAFRTPFEEMKQRIKDQGITLWQELLFGLHQIYIGKKPGEIAKLEG